jgi:hypothetical protein
MSRPNLFREIVGLAGADAATVIDAGSGWPGLARVTIPSGKNVPIALHVSSVGSHARRDYELRFQNPGNRDPVSNPRGSLPILVGLYQDKHGSVLVGLDGRTRLNREARFSILFNKSVITEARARMWALYTSSTGENIYAFHPTLLPIFVQIVSAGFDTPTAKATSDEVGKLAIAAGLVDDDTQGAPERARRAADILIRDRKFGKGVVRIYDGFCAMCGIDYGLVVGAHIYPASAPGSPDKAWNGLALCHNHHAAFDSHRIWVDPDDMSVSIHPTLEAQAPANPALEKFLEATFNELVQPTLKKARPKSEMFVKRYEYFEGRYDWAE